MASEASKLAKEILVDVESSASSYKQLKEENEKLKARNEEMKEERDKVITWSERAIKEIKQKYQEKIDDTADLAKELQNDYKKHIKEIEELKEKNKTLVDIKEKLKETVKKMIIAEDFTKDREQEIKTLKAENNKLKNRKMYKNLRADIETLEKENKELKSEVEELTEDSCECMECNQTFKEFEYEEVLAIVDPENEEQTKFMCKDCMEGSDYQNICTDCGNNYFCEDGITKTDGESYFDYCIFCYNDDKEALDKKYGKEE